MAFSNISDLSLGNILQIYYTDGIRTQISRDYKDWEMIKREKVSDPKGKQINFQFLNSLGPSAIQRKNPGVNGSFPQGHRVSNSEHTAFIKEIQATIELDYNLWKRAEMSKDARYAEPLRLEMDAKLDSLKRQLSLELHLDGTGVLGQIESSLNATVVSGGDLIVQLSNDDSARGHVGAFQFGEILIVKANGGGASAFDSNLVTEPVYFQVISRDFDNDTITIRGLDTNFGELTIASITTDFSDGDVFYKYGQPTIPNLASISDYGSDTEVMPGLESLTANDGRVVHGINMSGSTAGTRYDAGNVQLDTTHIESVMNNVKINVGSAYSYKQAILAPQAYSIFVNGRDGDRRFNSSEDLKNGARKWSYQHRDDNIELYASEFAKKKRMYILPEAKQGQGKVLEYHGTDFMQVKAPGEKDGFRLKASVNGGFENTVVSYMDSYGTLICKHPAAVAVIHNFTLA